MADGGSCCSKAPWKGRSSRPTPRQPRGSWSGHPCPKRPPQNHTCPFPAVLGTGMAVPTCYPPTWRNIFSLNPENIRAKASTLSSASQGSPCRYRTEKLCRIIFNVQFWKRNCINAINYGYRLNTSPRLKGKLTYAANQEMQFLETCR